MITTLGSMTGISYNSFITTQGNGKLTVPVQPGQVIYSQFEHVSGIAADNNSSGVSISKIQLLNTLIDQLVSMKQKPSVSTSEFKVEALSDNQADTLIKNFQTQIKSAMQLAQANPYVTGGITAPPIAAVLSFTV